MKLLFEYLTTAHVLEHLKAYMERPPNMSDPEHYAQLRRGVQNLMVALEAPNKKGDDVRELSAHNGAK